MLRPDLLVAFLSTKVFASSLSVFSDGVVSLGYIFLDLSELDVFVLLV